MADWKIVTLIQKPIIGDNKFRFIIAEVLILAQTKEEKTEYMRNYRKQRRDYFKQNHRCIRCGNKDERTLNGKTVCQSCTDKEKMYRMNKAAGIIVEKPKISQEERKKHCRKVQREYMREKRTWRKQHHMCTECGRTDALTLAGHSRCTDCFEKSRIYHGYKGCYDFAKPKKKEEYSCTKDERKERPDKGLCYLCGKPVRIDPKTGSPNRVCEDHYNKSLISLIKANEAYKAIHNGMKKSQVHWALEHGA